MRLYIKQILQSVMMAGLLPAVMISAVSSWYTKTDDQPILPEAKAPSYEITVLGANGESQIMELETYVKCVVMGEVSTEFHEEALKAQAVAARTYTLYCINVLKKHSGGAVCTNYQCCQAYCEPEDFLSKAGSEKGINKVEAAVDATAGEVLKYDSQFICATYFASSGGRTEDALEVWGQAYPYLKSVNSPGEENCGYYSQQVKLSPLELQEALGVCLTGKPSSWFGMVKYTVSGGIDLMRIGGRLYTGVELRRLLKLRSTVMTITATDEAILIDTKGYGHRVGLSQHGANAMASMGSGYRDILQHYYRNTTIAQVLE